MESEGQHPRAEEALRLLAAAAWAARLYPETSPLRGEAIDRFVARSTQIADVTGPLRYVVDPHAIRMGEEELAAGVNQVASLNESLHSLQVGQLIIAPGITAQETAAFVAVVNADPGAVRRAGGARAVLAHANVQHLAVIEVSLRSSENDGILGIDLASAPLDEIAEQLGPAAEEWARSAAEGAGTDQMTGALESLEQATRDIATTRVAQAFMRLDEDTRQRVLALSLSADASGQRMEGMLAVVARMKPASLARLLTLVAAQAGTQPGRIAGALSLPPETAKMLGMLLGPTPVIEPPELADTGPAPARSVAEEMTVEEDPRDLARQLALASPRLASGRALSTAVAVSRRHPDIESVRAIGTPLPDAVRDGMFAQVREALRRLDELEEYSLLADAVENVRAQLRDPAVLADICRAPMTEADAAIAGEILQAAGGVGAEALVTCYLDAPELNRSLLRPVLRGMAQPIVGVVGRRLRESESADEAVALVQLLPLLGDKRAVPTMLQALDHLDADVREAAVRALADTPGLDARSALAKAVNHWDPATQRFAVREIGRVGASEAVPVMLRSLEDINPFQKRHDLKKEIIASLALIGSPDAMPALKRIAGRKVVFGHKSKELRVLARRAVRGLAPTSAERFASTTEGVDAA